MNFRKFPNFLLRLGVSFALLYPPIDALSNPDSWVGYFPKFLHSFASNTTLLYWFGALEVFLALWILLGKKIFWPTLVVGFLLLSIIFFNMNNFEVVFRDVTIAAVAFALALETKVDQRAEDQTKDPSV